MNGKRVWLAAAVLSLGHGLAHAEGGLGVDDRFRLMFATAPASRVAALTPPEAAPFHGLLEIPVTGARISSGFGLRMHPILGAMRMHQGIDYAVSWGSPVVAAGDGVVEQAQWLGGYGRWIKLRHPGGWETGYGHLSDWTVKPGDVVRQGQVIAYSGSSGLSTGPHLHYEVIRAGLKIDPASAGTPIRIMPMRMAAIRPAPMAPAAQAHVPRSEAAPTTWAWGLIAAPPTAKTSLASVRAPLRRTRRAAR